MTLNRKRCELGGCFGTRTNHVATRRVTPAFVGPKLSGLGKLHTISSFCLRPVNPRRLLAAAQLHYYLPTVGKPSHRESPNYSFYFFWPNDGRRWTNRMARVTKQGGHAWWKMSSHNVSAVFLIYIRFEMIKILWTLTKNSQ